MKSIEVVEIEQDLGATFETRIRLADGRRLVGPAAARLGDVVDFMDDGSAVLITSACEEVRFRPKWLGGIGYRVNSRGDIQVTHGSIGGASLHAEQPPKAYRADPPTS